MQTILPTKIQWHIHVTQGSTGRGSLFGSEGDGMSSGYDTVQSHAQAPRRVPKAI